jgi:hypothetical protein
MRARSKFTLNTLIVFLDDRLEMAERDAGYDCEDEEYQEEYQAYQRGKIDAYWVNGRWPCTCRTLDQYILFYNHERSQKRLGERSPGRIPESDRRINTRALFT